MTGWRAGAAFLLVWLPYIASTFLAERVGDGGSLSQLMMVAAFVMIWPAARITRSDFGLRLDRRAAMLFLVFLLIGLGMAAARWELSILSGASVRAVDAWPGATAIAMLLFMAFVPSLAEDVLTRGFPLFAWGYRGAFVALGISAAMYTLNHLWRLDWGWTEQARLFAMGLTYGAAALAFRSLWAAVGLHLGGNVAPALLGGVAAKALDSDTDRLVSAGLHLAVAALFAVFVRLREKGKRVTSNAKATPASD